MPSYFRTNLTSFARLPVVHKPGCPALEKAKRRHFWTELPEDSKLIEAIVKGDLTPARLCKNCFDKKEAEALDRWLRGVRYGYQE